MGNRSRGTGIREGDTWQEDLRLLQDISGVGFFQWDIRRDRVSCWGEFEALYGIEKGAFPCNCEDWKKLVHPDDRNEADRQLKKAMESGRYEAEWRVTLPGGATRWIGGRGYVLRDEEGTPARLVGIHIDITAQKNLEQELFHSNVVLERYHVIFDSANDAFFIHCAESGTILDVNRKAEEMYGYSRDEICRLTVADLSAPGFVQEEALRVMHRVASGGPELFEWQGRHRSGRTFWVEVNLKKVVLEGKNRLLAVVRDITDRKEVTEALRKSEERLSLAQQGAGIGIWSLEMGAGEAVVSDNYFDILGVQRRKLSFDDFLDILHPEDRDGVRLVTGQALKEGGRFQTEFRVVQEDGNERWITGRGRVYRNEDGTPLRMSGIIFDITDRKRNEQELKRTMDELARSNRELEQFAYVASHDLQEPLRMVTSYLRLLEKKYRESLDEKATQFIHFAVDGADRMHRLIEGLLTYSRITSRRDQFRGVDTNAVFSGAVKNLEEAIRESGAEVTREPLPVVKGDETQLMQLMQNLLANSLKYRKPRIRPLIRVTAHREGREWVFSVMDNGIGIDPKHYGRIFQIFQRLHTQEEYRGTGIGLASCKKIVENHHGRIWVESVPGEGSTFFFTIPLDLGD